MPDDKQPDWLAEQRSKEDWMATRRKPVAAPIATVGGDDGPSWLADVQPKKKEWSPIQDRIDAHYASLRDLADRRRRRREAILRPLRGLVDWTAAVVEARNQLKAQAAAEEAAEAAEVRAAGARLAVAAPAAPEAVVQPPPPAVQAPPPVPSPPAPSAPAV